MTDQEKLGNDDDEVELLPEYEEPPRLTLLGLIADVKRAMDQNPNIGSSAGREWESNSEDPRNIIRKEWRDENFNVYVKMHHLKGPLIEVAGPTKSGYELVDFDTLDRKVMVSNIYQGTPKLGVDNKPEGFYGRVDFEADARQLPLKDKSAGAIFSSNFGLIQNQDLPPEERLRRSNEARIDVIKEANRVLKEGGLLIWQGGKAQDVEFAKQHGFVVRQMIETRNRIKPEDPTWYNIIFEKVADIPQGEK